jgi:GNAT superfamily N-acetyltransferase
VASLEDIPALNRLFSDAFTERYRRDGLLGVRVPQLNPTVWGYAIRDAGEGAMLWYDADHQLVAFNIAHCSGTEGWMGPLAVRTDRQGQGIGRMVVETAIDWLRAQGARTIGLETMPRTVDNIGFYSRMGFAPTYLTITLTRDVTTRGVAGSYLRLSRETARRQRTQVERCRDRLGRSAPGYDFTREIELSDELGVGDTVVVERDGDVAGFALFHSAPLADLRASDELRVLKLFADGTESLHRLFVVLEGCAEELRLRRVAVRCQTAYQQSFHALLAQGYRVRWTDLRMVLDGYPEARLAAGEVLYSNWEI